MVGVASGKYDYVETVAQILAKDPQTMTPGVQERLAVVRHMRAYMKEWDINMPTNL